MKLYGIANCSTVKKARLWLEQHNKNAEFHDFKKLGADAALLHRWTQQVGWEKLLNRQGTTWRQLPDDVKAATDNENAAIALMLEKPSVIKRPILEKADKILHVGFDENTYQTLFGKS